MEKLPLGHINALGELVRKRHPALVIPFCFHSSGAQEMATEGIHISSHPFV